MAQDRQDQAGRGEWEAKRVQEDLGLVHQLRETPETGEDQLGHASIPFGSARRGEGRGACGVQNFLPDTTEAMQLGRQDCAWQ